MPNTLMVPSIHSSSSSTLRQKSPSDARTRRDQPNSRAVYTSSRLSLTPAFKVVALTSVPDVVENLTHTAQHCRTRHVAYRRFDTPTYAFNATGQTVAPFTRRRDCRTSVDGHSHAVRPTTIAMRSDTKVYNVYA